MFLKIHKGLRIWFIFSSFCDLFIFNVSFNIRSIKDFFKLKTGESVLFEETFRHANSFLFTCSRCSYVWLSQWLEFSLGKPFVVGEVELPQLLDVDSHFPGIDRPFPRALIIITQMWWQRRRVGRDLAFGSSILFTVCFFIFGAFEPLSHLCFQKHL